MKARIVVGGLLASLILAAPASAHHVEQSKSSADCQGAKLALEDFSTRDGAVNWTAKVDGSTVVSGTEPAFTGDKVITITFPAPLSAGDHVVRLDARWTTSSGSASFTVRGCPGPPPPPPPAPELTPPSSSPAVAPPPPVAEQSPPSCVDYTRRDFRLVIGRHRLRVVGPPARLRWMLDGRYVRRAPIVKRFRRRSHVVVVHVKPRKGCRVFRFERRSSPKPVATVPPRRPRFTG